jgi:hypothetical protein
LKFPYEDADVLCNKMPIVEIMKEKLKENRAHCCMTNIYFYIGVLAIKIHLDFIYV